jgi:hypothetical protein
MYFKRFTWNWLSIMIGFHYGRNPVDGKRFLHVAPIPFFGIDFGFRESETLDDKMRFEDRERLGT